MRQDLVKLLKKIYTKISGGFLISVVARMIVLSSQLPARFLHRSGNNGSAHLARLPGEETKRSVRTCCGRTNTEFPAAVRTAAYY